MVIACSVVAAMMVAIIIRDIYNRTSHTSCKDKDALREDAVPIDVKRKKVGSKWDRRWRTTVVFNDGFKFISHKTDVDNYIIAYRVSVSNATNREIISDAIAAHEKALKKKNRK